MKKILLFFSLISIIILASCDSRSEPLLLLKMHINSDTQDVLDYSIEIGTEITLDIVKISSTKKGYTAENWYYDSDFNEAVAFPFFLDKNTDIYLKWIKNTTEENFLSVKFYLDDTEYANQSVKEGKTISKPENPTKVGHTFIGWSTNKDNYSEFDFASSITTNIFLYAFFEEVKHSITYILDNEIYEVHNVLDSYLDIAPLNPRKDSYTFLGWYDKENAFDFTKPITKDYTLTAKFALNNSTIIVSKCEGYNEGIFIELEDINGYLLSDYSFYYKNDTNNNYNPVDSQLIRTNGDIIRCDIVGLKAGEYSILIKAKNLEETKTVTVLEDDRSGYAHFNNTNGVGAYKNDGTLKENAIVVYVNDLNKNSVSAKIGSKTYIGLANIIKACTNSSYALCIRVLGSIKTPQWNYINYGAGNTLERQNALETAFNYINDTSGWDNSSSSNYSKLTEEKIISKEINSMSNDIDKGITKLNGLTNNVLRNKNASNGIYEYDSYYNMLDVTGGYNITIEGIGTDASIFQWGFAFKKCNSIEIKNLHFEGYTEDAVGFEGSSSDINYGNYWIHNCTFDIGSNNWDVCYEADKNDGDGATDFKYCHNVTVSYCQYNKTHKTNLIGSSDSAKQYNITLHHNYYNNCSSRLPLVRQTNLHIYNNYYYQTTGVCSSIRANAFVFAENNYYDSSKNPFNIVTSSTYANTTLKAFNNKFVNCSTSKSSTNNVYQMTNNAASRNEQFSGLCKPDGSNDYTNFDTNKALFYYDEVNACSDVKLLQVDDVKNNCLLYSGVLKGTFKSSDAPNEDNQNTPSSNNKIISFEKYETKELTQNTSSSNSTITIKSGKTCTIVDCDENINETNITKYISFGGGGSYNSLSVQFAVEQKANITVYYSSSGSTERYVSLFSPTSSIATSTTPTIPKELTIVNFTYENIEAGSYAIGSSNFGINIYLIIIEYI